MHITDESRLREIVGHPMEIIRDKARNCLADVDREWLVESPMVFLATADELGRIDVSPKGDPAGKVVHVIDDRHIAIPERPGNRRVDGYLNILRNPRAGSIFVVPGRGDTLRITGPARIVGDADYFDDLSINGKRPILAVEITVEEVFFHCPKAFLRSDLWRPDTWRPEALPSVAEITRRVMPEAGNERFTEDSFRPYLY